MKKNYPDKESSVKGAWTCEVLFIDFYADLSSAGLIVPYEPEFPSKGKTV
jgi:hypothetical protein